MKVLAYTTPARGHLYPVVPILGELLRRGHAVAIRTLASQVPAMGDCGFAAAPIDPAIEAIEHDDFRARSSFGKMKRGMTTFVDRAALEVADLRRAIDAERPDALLVDAMSLGASAVAEASGRPWAQWFPYPLPLPSKDAPPFGPGFAPARGPAGRLRDSIVRPMLTRAVTSVSLSPVNAVRTSVGVAPFATLTELFTAAPLLLYMTAEPFDYPRSDWPACVRMVGPCPWEPPADPPAWLAGVDRPIVLVSTSSEFQDDGLLVTTALEALAEDDVQVIATVPSAGLPVGAVPANARVERFLPHTPILARAGCAVTHGGAGATQKALAAGVPVCVVPFGRDQMEVARRVEVAGAGTRLVASRLTPERLRAAVREAMTRTAGARRVSEGYERTGGAAAAAGLFEELAAVAGERGMNESHARLDELHARDQPQV